MAFAGTAWYDNHPDGMVYAGKVAYTYKGTMPENTEIVFEEGTTGIAGSCFYNNSCSGLVSVTIPSSVMTIGDQAFTCSNLTSVTVDISSPITIGRYHFSNCANATLYVPKGSKEAYESAEYWKEFKEIIEDETLKGSPYKVGDTFIVDGVLYQVTCVDPLEVQVGNGNSSSGSVAIETSIEGAFEIPATVTGADENVYSVTAISKRAFSGCSGMTSVTIPSSVISIAGGFDFGESAFVGGAFENCGLTSLTIPISVTSIGGGAFASCSNLVSIVVEEGNTVYDSRNNCNAIIEKENNCLIAGCKNTVIPDGVINIGAGAFYGCTGLTSMDIPNSVTYISDYAFMYCNELTSLNISENVTSIGTQVFAYCSGLTSITIPESEKNNMAQSFLWVQWPGFCLYSFQEYEQVWPAYLFWSLCGDLR